MFIIERIRKIPPIYLVVGALFVLGVYCLGLSLSYDDCSWMANSLDISFDLDNSDNCADSMIEQSLFPVGLFMIGIAPILPGILTFLERGASIEGLKIND